MGRKTGGEPTDATSSQWRQSGCCALGTASRYFFVGRRRSVLREAPSEGWSVVRARRCDGVERAGTATGTRREPAHCVQMYMWMRAGAADGLRIRLAPTEVGISVQLRKTRLKRPPKTYLLGKTAQGSPYPSYS